MANVKKTSHLLCMTQMPFQKGSAQNNLEYMQPVTLYLTWLKVKTLSINSATTELQIMSKYSRFLG